MKKKLFKILNLLLIICLVSTGCFNQVALGSKKIEQLALAVKYMNESNYDEAIVAFETDIKIDPKEAAPYKGLAAVYQIKGDLDKAKGVLNEGLAKATDKQDLKLALADVLYEQKDYQPALALYEELDKVKTGSINPELTLKIAKIYTSMGDTQRATQVLESTLGEKNTDIRLALAEIYSDQGNKQKALEYLDEALDINNNCGRVFILLPYIYGGGWDQMIDEGRQMVDRDVNSKLGNMMVFYGLCRSGKYSEAVSQYANLINLLQDCLELKVALASTYYLMGDKDNASITIGGIDKSKVDNPFIMVDMAFYYSDTGDQNQANAAVGRALDITRDIMGFYDNLSKIANNYQNQSIIRYIGSIAPEKNKDRIRKNYTNYLNQVVSPYAQINITQVDASHWPITTAYFSVTDFSGRTVEDIGGNNISFFNNFVPVYGDLSKAESQWNKLPLDIVMVIDVSGSMDGYPLDQAKKAATEFTRQSGVNARLGLVTFGNSVSVLSKLNPDKEQLVTTIDGLRAGGGTPLFDGVLEAMNLFSDDFGRKVMVVMTDGQNNQGMGTVNQVIDRAKQKNTSVYTIGLGNDVNVNDLRSMSNSTGGQFYLSPTSDELSRLYLNINQQVRGEYKFTFVDKGSNDEAGNFEVYYQTRFGTIVARKGYTVEGWAK